MREPSRIAPPFETYTPPFNIILNIVDAFCQRFSTKNGENNIFYNGDRVIIIARNENKNEIKIVVSGDGEPKSKEIGNVRVIYFGEDDFVKDVISIVEEQISQITNRARFVSLLCTATNDCYGFVSIDSVKLSIPKDFVIINEDCFERVIYEKANYSKLFLTFSENGLKLIEVKGNEVIVDASAKILEDKYFLGLTLQTVKDFFEKINEIGAIYVSDEGIINARLLRCDVTDNIKLSSKDELKSYLHTLSLIENAKYLKRVYKSSVVFERSVKTYKERIIFYDKSEELKREKNLKWLKDFENVLRVEQNITAFERIRKVFEIETNRLIDVLSSKAKPNAVLLERIVEGAKERENLEGLNARQLKEHCFLSYLKEHYSLAEAKKFLESHMSRRAVYKYLSKLKQLKKRESLKKKVQEIIEILYGAKT